MNNRNRTPIDDQELDRHIDDFLANRIPPSGDFSGRVLEAVRRDRELRRRRLRYWTLGGAAGIAATLLLSVRVMLTEPGMEPASQPLVIADASPIVHESSSSGMDDLQELFEAAHLYSEARHLEALLAEAGSQLDDDHEQTLEILTYFAGL